MPKTITKRSFAEITMDEILAAAAGKRYSDAEVCKRARMSKSTFSRRKSDPDSLTLGELSRLKRILDLNTEVKR